MIGRNLAQHVHGSEIDRWRHWQCLALHWRANRKYQSGTGTDRTLTDPWRPKLANKEVLAPGELRSVVSVEQTWEDVVPSRAALSAGAWSRVRKHERPHYWGSGG